MIPEGDKTLSRVTLSGSEISTSSVMDDCRGILGDLWRALLSDENDNWSGEICRSKGGEDLTFFSLLSELFSVLEVELALPTKPLAVLMTKFCNEGPMDLRLLKALLDCLCLSEAFKG